MIVFDVNWSIVKVPFIVRLPKVAVPKTVNVVVSNVVKVPPKRRSS